MFEFLQHKIKVKFCFKDFVFIKWFGDREKKDQKMKMKKVKNSSKSGDEKDKKNNVALTNVNNN